MQKSHNVRDVELDLNSYIFYRLNLRIKSIIHIHMHVPCPFIRNSIYFKYVKWDLRSFQIPLSK